MQEIERELLEKAGGGDGVAFREIYERSSGFVYSLAFRVTNRKQDAEEVTQDVFLKVYKSLQTFKFESSFKTWLYRVTMNTALNTLKQKNRIVMRETEQEEEAVLFTPPQASRALEAQEAEKELRDLLSHLNPDQRACIVLREIEGLDYQAIAKNLGININTVRSRLKRAREALMLLGQAQFSIKKDKVNWVSPNRH